MRCSRGGPAWIECSYVCIINCIFLDRHACIGISYGLMDWGGESGLVIGKTHKIIFGLGEIVQRKEKGLEVQVDKYLIL